MAGSDVTYRLFADVPHYSMQVEIENLIYRLRFLFNEADGFWYIHILDETGSIEYRAGRRVIPTGPWLSVDEDQRISLEDFRALYDLAGGLFPGMLRAVSTRPLELRQDDLNHVTLDYVTAESLATAVPG